MSLDLRRWVLPTHVRELHIWLLLRWSWICLHARYGRRLVLCGRYRTDDDNHDNHDYDQQHDFDHAQSLFWLLPIPRILWHVESSRRIWLHHRLPLCRAKLLADIRVNRIRLRNVRTVNLFHSL